MAKFLEVPGMHMSAEERWLLFQLAERIGKEFEFPTIVNIGIAQKYGCCSMYCLRTGCKKATLIGVDIQEQGEVPHDLGENTHFIIEDSIRVGATWYGKVHLLFVDGAHSQFGVRNDIMCWSDTIVLGGYMIFHDYNRHGPGFEHVAGVKAAVDIWNESPDFSGWKFMEDIDSIRYFKRVA